MTTASEMEAPHFVLSEMWSKVENLLKRQDPENEPYK